MSPITILSTLLRPTLHGAAKNAARKSSFCCWIFNRGTPVGTSTNCSPASVHTPTRDTKNTEPFVASTRTTTRPHWTCIGLLVNPPANFLLQLFCHRRLVLVTEENRRHSVQRAKGVGSCARGSSWTSGATARWWWTGPMARQGKAKVGGRNAQRQLRLVERQSAEEGGPLGGAHLP